MSFLFTRSQVDLFAECVQATVEEKISPDSPGRAKYDGTYWPARLYQETCTRTFEPGDRVKVVGIEGITLLIVPC